MIWNLLRMTAVRTSVAFVLLLFIYEYAVLRPDQDRQALLVLLERGRELVFVRSLLTSIVSIGTTIALAAVALRAGYVARTLCFVLFSTALVIEYAHHAAFERFSHYSTAAVGAFAGDWLFSFKAVLMYFNPYCLPPILTFAALLILQHRRQNSTKQVVLVVVFALMFAAATAFFSSNRFLTVSPWASLRTAVGFPIVSLFGRQGTEAFGPAKARESVAFAAGTRPTNNIVLIVDESVRADHLQINGYPATPVPLLSAMLERRELANYGIASAGSTCSSSANSLLLTGLTQLPDRSQRIYELPTIFQFARAMSYRTYEFDGQVSTIWKGTVDDLKFVQHRETPVHLAGSFRHEYEIDGEIARRVKSIVEGSVGNFIWVNKRGMHKPYSDNFPKRGGGVEDAWWVGYDRRISTRELVADYDSSIRYNLNLFFDRLLDRGAPSANTIYIYTSDHGQSLRQGGVQVSHCSSSRAEALVPLFIFGRGLAEFDLDTRYKASHANIFPTLLDLMQVPEQARRHPYAISLIGAKQSDSTRRYYFDEDLTGEDGGQRYPFDP